MAGRGELRQGNNLFLTDLDGDGWLELNRAGMGASLNVIDGTVSIGGRIDMTVSGDTVGILDVQQAMVDADRPLLGHSGAVAQVLLTEAGHLSIGQAALSNRANSDKSLQTRALVEGPGSRWDVDGTLTLGWLGDGQSDTLLSVDVLDGGVITSNLGLLAARDSLEIGPHNAIVEVTVGGSDSRWDITSDLGIAGDTDGSSDGVAGTATLNIVEGGAVTSRDAWVAEEAEPSSSAAA